MRLDLSCQSTQWQPHGGAGVVSLSRHIGNSITTRLTTLSNTITVLAQRRDAETREDLGAFGSTNVAKGALNFFLSDHTFGGRSDQEILEMKLVGTVGVCRCRRVGGGRPGSGFHDLGNSISIRIGSCLILLPIVTAGRKLMSQASTISSWMRPRKLIETRRARESDASACTNQRPALCSHPYVFVIAYNDVRYRRIPIPMCWQS